jgi:hypothetical protein
VRWPHLGPLWQIEPVLDAPRGATENVAENPSPASGGADWRASALRWVVNGFSLTCNKDFSVRVGGTCRKYLCAKGLVSRKNNLHWGTGGPWWVVRYVREFTTCRNLTTVEEVV